MSLKSTPEKKTKIHRLNMGPRRINLGQDTTITNVNQRIEKKIKLAKQKSDPISTQSNTNIVLNPSICYAGAKVYRQYPSVYSLAYSPVFYPPTYTPALPVVTTMSPYVPPPLLRGYPSYSSPYSWNMVSPMPVQRPVYPVPVRNMPVALYSPGAPSVCSYPGAMCPIVTQFPYPNTSPKSASNVPSDCLNQSFDSAFYDYTGAPTLSEEVAYSTTSIDTKIQTSPVRSQDQCKALDLEDYLVLPRDLFPTARTLAVNPNIIINEFCLETDIIEKHSPWILDLEFGVPRVPVTRPIATYDVQYNSIHCKNTPEAIHPGFESCSENFKTAFLFYYDCIVSTWYKGFVISNSDKSVANFQSWLKVPMNKFGMCWP